jgi:hypothetical protein
MPKERDLAQFKSVARRYRMTTDQLRELSLLVHAYKEAGFRGTKNNKGDFTYQELCDLAKQLLEIEE